jgi:putative copper resistance protein D
MIQHLLLIMVAPVLVIWADPLGLARAAFPARPQAAGRRAAGLGRAGPVVGLVGYTAVVVLTHLTGFQQVSAAHSWARTSELVLYLVCGTLFLYPLVGSGRGLPHLLRLALLALGMGADTLTGVALMLTSHPLAPIYAATHPGWGPDALHDQQVAGAVMWFGGDLLMMVLMIVVGVRWSRAEPDQQGLGAWLEGARRRALLGADDMSGGLPQGADVDSDQRALDAYNATLAALHGLTPATRPEGPGAGSGAAGDSDGMRAR